MRTSLSITCVLYNSEHGLVIVPANHLATVAIEQIQYLPMLDTLHCTNFVEKNCSWNYTNLTKSNGINCYNISSYLGKHMSKNKLNKNESSVHL